MKYKDLIEKLLPFSEEDISMTISDEEKYYSLDADGSKHGNRKCIVSEVRFYHPFEDNNDLIVGVRAKYDKKSFEDLSEAEIFE